MRNSSEGTDGVITYEFLTKNKKIVSISIEDVEENPKFLIRGPIEIISKAIGGIGDDDEENGETFVTEKHLNTEAKRMFAVLETTKMLETGEY